ncbi:MAG TPA: undecaprenyldiphospho-muramoylpentapeptide beta-N-acetylglucosaminyltransferase [Corynebacteriales bacterium]|nr:undecaprenyldiphospho-muramoylpentapeptide beta-N-acetylglucosaminyltransferase [Mycobacteriales bacterium]
MKKIVLTGGGSAGHVTPHFALIPHLQREGYEIHYIGTAQGIERELVEGKIPYYPISAGKLRRYMDIKNFTDPFRVIKGMFQSYAILRKIRPSLVFSKGGFVTVPVTFAAWMLRIPVVLHESDLTPGLANRLSLPFASHLCLTFPDSLSFVKNNKATVTGTPIRAEILQGSRDAGLRLCGFSHTRPVILVMGGSLGSVILNQVVRDNLLELTKRGQVIHLCGKGNADPGIRVKGYCQFEYVNEEMPHLLAAADFVVSRAGANSIFELCALAKPNILVPLSKQASRGDQILNARSFQQQGFSLVIEEEELTSHTLLKSLDDLQKNQDRFVQAMEASTIRDGTNNVLSVIRRFID